MIPRGAAALLGGFALDFLVVRNGLHLHHLHRLHLEFGTVLLMNMKDFLWWNDNEKCKKKMTEELNGEHILDE